MKVPAFFIHVPKCGGMSMEIICKEHNIYIDPINNSDEQLKNKRHYEHIENYEVGFSFSFVRNPFSRLVSAFKCPWVNGEKKSDKTWLKYFDNFDEFIDSFVLDEKSWPWFKWSHVMPFTDPRMKLYDSTGKQLIDFIGKLETYQDDFNFVCEKLNIPQQTLPHVNKTKHKHYTEFYTSKTREIVTDIYLKDIEKFDYKFGT